MKSSWTPFSLCSRLHYSNLQCTSEQNLRVNLHFCTWHLATCVSSFFVAVLLCTLVSGQWERQTRLVLLRSRLARCCFVNSKKMFASLRGHPIRKKFEIYEPPLPFGHISNFQLPSWLVKPRLREKRRARQKERGAVATRCSGLVWWEKVNTTPKKIMIRWQKNRHFVHATYNCRLWAWEAHKNSWNVLVLINQIANNKVSAKHFLSLLMSDAHSFPLPLAFDIKSFVLAGR